MTHYWIQNRFGREPIPLEALFADARRRGARYIVFSAEDRRFSGLPQSAFDDIAERYHRIHADDTHTIFDLRSEPTSEHGDAELSQRVGGSGGLRSGQRE